MQPPIRKLAIKARDRVYMRLSNFTFKVRQGEFGEERENAITVTEASDFGIKPIWIGFVKRKGEFYIELTGMTEEELDLFQAGMISALDAAREVVKYLDEHADAEYDDDTPMIPLRALRTSPVVIMRKIRPFIGTEMDPVETKVEQKVYDDDMPVGISATGG
jgi:hypothetical protein